MIHKFCFFIIFLNLFSFQHIYSHKTPKHIEDMRKVLGVENNQNIDSLFKKITEKMDAGHISEFYKNLQNNFPYFTIGAFKESNSNEEKRYGHRLIYHWGFDIDIDSDADGIPKSMQYPNALSKQFEAKFIEYYGESKRDMVTSDWNRFLKEIKKNQAEVNRDFIKRCINYTGLEKKYARDICAVLYYTHLLGDHIEHEGADTGEAVLELEKIVKNLNNHVESLAKNESSLFSKFKTNSYSNKKIPLESEKKAAEDILKNLKKWLPKILEAKFSKQFEKRNINFINRGDL